jgi:putative nucleotidyltransferase with HDIG domain
MNVFKRKQPVAVRETPPGKDTPLSGVQIALLAVVLILLSLCFSILLTRQSHFSAPPYRPGDIARADIIIPMDALIEDETATQTRRAEAKAKALPVYRYNPLLQDDQESRLKAAFVRSRVLLGKTRGRTFRSLPAALKAELRSNMRNLGMKPPVDDLLVFLAREGFPPALEEQIILLLKDLYSGTFILGDTIAGEKEGIHAVNITTGKVETVPATRLSTPAQVRSRIAERLSHDSRLSVSGRTHARRILEGLIVPNLTFDESMTKARQEEAVKDVDHVLRKLKKGKVVLRQGDEVGPDHLVQIEAIRKLSPAGSSLKQTIGMAALIGILLTILALFVRFIASSQWSYVRLVGLFLLTLTANLLLIKASWFVCESVSQSFAASPFNDKMYFFYLLPFAYGSMLITLLAGVRRALLFTIFLCFLAGQSLGADTYGLFYILITSLTGIVFMRNVFQRIGIIGAGFKLGLSAAVLFFILQTTAQAPLDLMSGSFGAALAFLSGFFNALFLVFTLPLCERIFLVTTEMRLSELGNLNLPLIRELILKAPGTYNHSIAVGTLCEGAAKAIGLNPLFLRIACLYHDIGKTARPDFFVENQQGAVSPHDRISPQESAHILQDHVTCGISMARKANLPPTIVDLIPQHHGTKSMQFFYEKAKGQAAESGGRVQEDEFRYCGPKPQTKAAAILLLADGIEAAARTLNSHSQNKLLDLIRKIIADTTEDGQFAECDITLSEINRITYSFLETLSSYYHDRIVYPGFDFNQGSIAVSDSEPIKQTAEIRH